MVDVRRSASSRRPIASAPPPNLTYRRKRRARISVWSAPRRHRPRRRRCARRRVAGRPVWSQRVPAVPIQAHRFGLHGGCREALRRDSWRLAEHKTPANTWWTASGSNRRPPPCKGPRASPNESRRTPGIWVAEWLQTDRHATIGQHSCSRPACTLRSSQSDSVTPRSASRWTPIAT